MEPEIIQKNRPVTDKEAQDITRTEELAYELKIDEVMTHNARIVDITMKMGEVLEIFRTQRISGAPVLDEGKLVGVVSMEDLIRCLTNNDLDAPIRMYMSSHLITVKRLDPVIEALKIFVVTQVGRLPVIDADGKLCGILTKGDVNRGLLKALQRDDRREELIRYRARHLFEDIESDRTSLILRYTIKFGDFTNGGAASANIKRALLRLGASPLIARRCGIAIYEAEMNLIIHTNHGGVLRVEIEPHKISITVTDDGPGIADPDLAMRQGYSTASEEIRELGFGAGMGLANISRCVDNMKLESVVGKGTRLTMKIFLNKEESVGEGYPASSGEIIK